MKYSIETTDYGCIEPLEISNGEKYQKRTQRIKGGCRSLDDDFSDQMEKAGIDEEIIEKAYEVYDDFGALDFMELAELIE